MALNPVNEGLLLIAYANGLLVEWDLKTRSIVKSRHSKQVPLIPLYLNIRVINFFFRSRCGQCGGRRTAKDL